MFAKQYTANLTEGTVMSRDLLKTLMSHLDRTTKIGWKDVSIPQAAQIIEQDRPANSVFILSDGSVKLIRLGEDASEVIVDVDFSCCCVGTSEVIIRTNYMTSAYALEPCHGVEVSAELFRSIIQSNRTLYEAIHFDHIESLHRRTARLSELTNLPSRDRLLRFLRDLVDRSRRGNPQTHSVRKIAMKKVDLAAAISVTPSHLSRTLLVLEEEGLIQRKDGWIIVKSGILG